MEIISQAESIGLFSDSGSAVIVAEGLRSWSSSCGQLLVSRGPRLKAVSQQPDRFRTVPDRIGVVDQAAETHAVILSRRCRTEEMELTQRWYFSAAHALCADLEFIVPPAHAGLEKLGVELDHPGSGPGFDLQIQNGVMEKSTSPDGGVISVFLPFSPVDSGIYRMNLVFLADFCGK